MVSGWKPSGVPLRTARRAATGPLEGKRLDKESEGSESSQLGPRVLSQRPIRILLGICFLLGLLYCLGVVWPDSAPFFVRTPFEQLAARVAQITSTDSQGSPSSHPKGSEHKMGQLTELSTSVIKPGSGMTVQKGQRVTVHATGSVLQADGTIKKFWSTKDADQQPFTWQAGLGQVIAGWDQGVLGMSLGETRRILIPAKMGYGARGFPAWGIPPSADLQFEIECLKIQ